MRKGQVSIEYMLVLGFMLLLLTPLLVLYVNTQRDTTDTLVEGQLKHVGNTLRDAAEHVYFAGAPAQEQLQVYLPDGVQAVTFTNTSLIFTVGGAGASYELLIPSVAPLNGSIRTNKGVHIITIRAVNATVEFSE